MKLTKEQIIEFAKNTEGVEALEIEDKTLYFSDSHERDREINITFPEYLEIEELFEFNSAKVDKDKFFKILKKYMSNDSFICVEKIVFLNTEKEVDDLLEEYQSQFFDINKHLGMHWYMDNVVLVNVNLCREEAKKSADEICSFEEDFNRAVWETLIHEIRHAECSNPIIPLTVISNKEASEEGVEDFCRDIFDKISKNEDYFCFE